MDARIGTLNDGSFYAFANGYDQPEVRGTLDQVEAALGLCNSAVPTATDRYNVTLYFRHPAWDEKDGISYDGIRAKSKADAISTARQMARNDGHTGGGKGRYWFRADAD